MATRQKAKKRQVKKKVPQRVNGSVPAGAVQLVVRDPVGLLPQPAYPAGGTSLTLSDDTAVGALGLVEVKLTKEEDAALSVDVDAARVSVKPTGEAYYSHPEYTKLFNAAFGRTGWNIRPAAKPMKTDTGVAVPYIFSIHGQPVAFAIGEQDYHANNKRQTWGEAIESTVASGLRRCAKRLGVGLELWDKKWLDRFLREHCVKVPVIRRDKEEWWWRRKDDPPYPGERSGRRAPQDSTPRHDEPPRDERPPAAYHGNESDPITQKQLIRLFTIASKHGHKEPEVKAWLKGLGFASSKAITRGKYDAIVSAVERPGPLAPLQQPAPPAEPVREPDEILDASDIQWGGR